MKRRENLGDYNNYTSLPNLPSEVEEFIEDKSKNSIFSRKWVEHLKPQNKKEFLIKDLYESHKIETEEIIRNENFIVTTHSKFFSSPLKTENFDIVIFDECIVDSYLKSEISNCRIDECLKIINTNHSHKLREELRKLRIGNTLTLSLTDFEKNEINNILNLHFSNPTEFSNNFPNIKAKELKFLKHLLDIVHIYKAEIGYQLLIENKLPNNNKYLVLSATPAEIFYENKFCENYELKSLKSPKFMAKLTTDSSKNITKTDLSNPIIKEQILKSIDEYKQKGYKVISYLCLDSELHFQKTTSNNDYEGENLLILGTPLKSPEYFSLLVHALGIGSVKDCDFENIKRERIKFKNGTVYFYNISSKSAINEIYYELAKNDIIQAIGRPRPHEHKTHIILWSAVEIDFE